MNEIQSRIREWEIAKLDFERFIKEQERGSKMIIIGSGGLGKEVAGLLMKNGIRVDGFISEDGPGEVLGLPIFGNDQWLVENKGLTLVMAIGTPRIRKKILDLLWFGGGHQWAGIIDDDAHLYHKVSVKIGTGTVILPGVVLGPDVTLGRFVHINMGATIGHDVTIGDYCVINPNSAISGSVTIGEQVLIGAGAVVLEGRTIGDGATIGAGAVVTKDVPPGETWVGVPAKRLQREVEAELEKMTYAEIYGIEGDPLNDVEFHVEVV